MLEIGGETPASEKSASYKQLKMEDIIRHVGSPERLTRLCEEYGIEYELSSSDGPYQARMDP